MSEHETPDKTSDDSPEAFKWPPMEHRSAEEILANPKPPPGDMTIEGLTDEEWNAFFAAINEP